MDPCYNQPSDIAIISMLTKNVDEAWVSIYDKYASMMYGIILNMTGNETLAGEILTDVFVKLRKGKLLSRVRAALCHTLVRHTHKLTFEYLKKRGLKPISTQSSNGDYPIISSLYFELATINEGGDYSDRSKEEILINIREEFNHFRNQTK